MKRIIWCILAIITFCGVGCSKNTSLLEKENDYISDNIGALIYVPEGTFQRDANSANTSNVSSFYISKTEITRKQFDVIMGYDPSINEYSSGKDDPVQMVNWYHALVFCNKLSFLDGLTPVYSIKGSTDPTQWGNVPTGKNNTWDTVEADWTADGYRLPTEMEWMWAAMGADKDNPGKINTNGYKKRFAGDNGINNSANYVWSDSNSNNKTHPLSKKLPNELGLTDMSGNVSEWCWDWSATYPDGNLSNYKGAVSGDYRTVRGGGWNSKDFFVGVVSRFFESPYSQSNGLGFRVIRVPKIVEKNDVHILDESKNQDIDINDYTSKYIGTLKYVPEGAFQRNGNPNHISKVSEFRMSVYEITRAQYLAVVGVDPTNNIRSKGIDNPVHSVSWHDTLVFCNKLSLLEGLTPVYIINGSTNPADWGDVPVNDNYPLWDEVKANWTADGYRLPTEMEWMWAAMGADKDNPGKINTNGYKKRFAGDNGKNSVNDYAWYSDNSKGTTHPIGKKSPNELGIFDLSGNVWEWCWDRHGDYPIGRLDNYRGAESGTHRVQHGGSWCYPDIYVSITERYSFYPRYDDTLIGFRVVRN